MQPGDSLFVYTDGIPESCNASKEMFGTDRLADTLNENPEAGPETQIRYVYKAVTKFADDEPQFDDITMLALRYNGPQAGENERV